MLGTQKIDNGQQYSLTSEARKILAKKIGENRSNEAIRYLTADQFTDLASLGDFDALLVAFGNFCPYCRALKQTLADAAHALMTNRKQKTPVHIVMFETGNDKNREFATTTLKNKYVPAFFLLRARNGKISIEEWSNSDQIVAKTSENGEMQKVLPISVLLNDLSTKKSETKLSSSSSSKSSKSSKRSDFQVSKETMQKYREAARLRHEAKLAKLNLK